MLHPACWTSGQQGGLIDIRFQPESPARLRGISVFTITIFVWSSCHTQTGPRSGTLWRVGVFETFRSNTDRDFNILFVPMDSPFCAHPSKQPSQVNTLKLIPLGSISRDIPKFYNPLSLSFAHRPYPVHDGMPDFTTALGTPFARLKDFFAIQTESCTPQFHCLDHPLTPWKNVI
jgi:hypothetical protein